MIIDNATTTWWVFYPVKGLDIATEKPELDKPMFEDATLISKRHLGELVRLLRLKERMTPGHDHEQDIYSLLQHATLEEKYHSMIAVKRRGPVNNDTSAGLQRLGEKRASTISALLSLALIAESSDWRTCALVEQIHRRNQSLAMLAIDIGSFSLQLGGHQSHTILGNPMTVSTAELRRKLDAPALAPLTDVLQPQRPSLAKSLVDSTVESSIRLSDALHSPSAAGQLLGAVTSIEILISDQGDSFETTKRRIVSLIGENAFNFYDGDRILNERHLYVHRGIEPSHGTLPTKGTGLALACILQYAQLVPKFSDRHALITYLDFLHLGNRMSDNWNVTEKENFKRLTKHEPIQSYFHFFTSNPNGD